MGHNLNVKKDLNFVEPENPEEEEEVAEDEYQDSEDINGCVTACSSTNT